MPTRNLTNVSRNKEKMNPLREINRLQGRIDRVFDEFLTSPLSSLVQPGRNMFELEESVFAPPTDLEETDSHYLVSLDIPGVKKADVKIEVKDNQLLVSGEKQEEHKEEHGNVLSMERYQGSFVRSFILPSNVNSDKIEASYQDGVLRIAIPKAEASKPKLVQIKGNEEKEGKVEKLEKRSA